MNTRQTLFLTAVTAFASGFFAGMLFAPSSGREARRRLAQTAHDSTRWVGDQWHTLEDQLGVLEEQIQASSVQLGESLRDIAHKAVDPYVPLASDEAGDWTMERDEMAQDLRHLPRK